MSEAQDAFDRYGSWYAVFLRVWPNQPIFHKPDFERREVDYTQCGRLIVDSPWLPIQHALKIGRPCKGCWR